MSDEVGTSKGDQPLDESLIKKQSPLARVASAMAQAWQPQPVTEPRVDPDLESLSAIERVAEVCKYNILLLEFALSPRGGLRSWLKLNVLAAIVLFIPALILIPAVTYLLSGFATWTSFLSQIATNLLNATISLMLVLLILVVGGRLVVAQLRSEFRNGRKR